MKERILELRAKGYSYNKIVAELGCAKSTVSFHCKDTVESKFKAKTEKDIELINETYSINKSVSATSKILKMCKNTVVKYLNDENFKNYCLRVKTEKTKSNYVVDWRKRTKIKLVEYKGGCCIKCGYNKSMNALQFHHLDPNEKDFQISGKSYSFDRMKEEVDKCILVCANCHIEIHEK